MLYFFLKLERYDYKHKAITTNRSMVPKQTQQKKVNLMSSQRC